jgi:hypothetical protein
LLRVHIEHLVELERTFLLFVIYVSFVLIFFDKEFGAVLFFVHSWVVTILLKPLKTFLEGRTLRMISIAEFFDIELYSLFKSKFSSNRTIALNTKVETRVRLIFEYYAELVESLVSFNYNYYGRWKHLVPEKGCWRIFRSSRDNPLGQWGSSHLQQLFTGGKEGTALKVHPNNYIADQRTQPNKQQPLKGRRFCIQTKAYSQITTVNFYYDEYLIHLAHAQHLIVTIFMAKDTNVDSAREISTELLHTFEKLNTKVEDIRKHCNWYLSCLMKAINTYLYFTDLSFIHSNQSFLFNFYD